MELTTIEKAKAGDRDAMQAVLEQLAPSVQRFSVRMCGNLHDADDAVQDTLLAVATNLRDFEGRAALSSWAFAIARSVCAKTRRGLKNQPMAEFNNNHDVTDEAPSPESNADARERLQQVMKALDSLQDDYREVIALRDIEAQSATETADVLGISVDAVKSRLHRAREALRIALKPIALTPATSQGCSDVASLWSRKLEGDLSSTDCKEMQAHLEKCEHCRVACETLREALLACQQAKHSHVSRALQTQVKSAIQQWLHLTNPASDPTRTW